MYIPAVTTLVAAVVGASGYAGGELVRLLLGHPGARGRAAGRRRQRRASASPTCTRTSPLCRPHVPRAPTLDALADADVVFLALPHGESGAIAAALPADTLVVDLGADHRLERRRRLDRATTAATHAGTWTYGMPELAGQRARIAEPRAIANPGCYPTGVILGLAPLLAAGLVEPDDVVVVAASAARRAPAASRATRCSPAR